MAVAAGLASGPTVALLHETGILSVGPRATLWPLGAIVIAAMLGVGVGRRVWSEGSRVWGAVVVTPNAMLLLYYGFFLFFFGMGGSR